MVLQNIEYRLRNNREVKVNANNLLYLLLRIFSVNFLRLKVPTIIYIQFAASNLETTLKFEDLSILSAVKQIHKISTDVIDCVTNK